MKRIVMRKIRSILHLKFKLSCSNAIIAEALQTSETTVENCLARAKAAGISWPIPEEIDNVALEEARNHPEEAYSYSRFCELYQKWRKESETWMIQKYKAGETTFLDYAGTTIPIFNRDTEKKEFDAQIFVSALAASGCIFCHASRSQTTDDWLFSHEKMSEFYGGVTACWVPDNLKSAVTKANRDEPEINRSYAEMADHYGVTVIPATMVST